MVVRFYLTVLALQSWALIIPVVAAGQDIV